MKNTPYDSYYYWENLLIKNEQIWENSFRNMPLTKESIFIHHVVVNCYGDSDNGWVYYPNVKALLGFIEYVFLPSAYNTRLLGSDNSEFAVPMCTVGELLDIAHDGMKAKHIEFIPEMENDIERLHSFWGLDDRECIEEIRKFSEEFNVNWSKGLDIFFYFNIYETPSELGEYIINTYEEEDMLDMIEKDLGLAKDEWLQICSTVYENEFMRRKFVDVLNNKIKDMI